MKKQALKKHGLLINSEYFSQEIARWDENSILERAMFLGKKFLEIWPAIGEATPLSMLVYGTPKAVTISGQKIELPEKTWRQLRKLTTEWVIKNHPEKFEKARQALATYFCDAIEGKKFPKDWYQLSNKVWILQKSSAKGHMNFCRRLLIAVDIYESEWSVEEVENTTSTNSGNS